MYFIFLVLSFSLLVFIKKWNWFDWIVFFNCYIFWSIDMIYIWDFIVYCGFKVFSIRKFGLCWDVLCGFGLGVGEY